MKVQHVEIRHQSCLYGPLAYMLVLLPVYGEHCYPASQL